MIVMGEIQECKKGSMMEFGNLIAYCKGWYQAREGGVSEMWKDMAHCIICDGFLCTTKKDVAMHCVEIMDEFTRKCPDYAYKVSVKEFFQKIERNREINRIELNNGTETMELDEYDHIIWAFRDIFRYIDGELFDAGYVPSEKVLPLNPDVSESLWENVKDNFDAFNDKVWWYQTYDEIEKQLK